MKPIPKLDRTRAALAAYDRADCALRETDFSKLERGRALEIIARLEILAEDVGRQFGLDTADRNNLSDCTRLVRPGPARPQGGDADLSFVRRMVLQDIQ